MNPDNQTSVNQSTTTPQVDTPVAPTAPKSNVSQMLSNIKDKIPQPAKDMFNKFYSNKMIFWPITIVFGLLFLTIILGLLFGTKTPPAVQKTIKPTPVVIVTPNETPSTDTLSEVQSKLSDFKSQINSLDVRQSTIKPPTINFDIKF